MFVNYEVKKSLQITNLGTEGAAKVYLLTIGEKKKAYQYLEWVSMTVYCTKCIILLLHLSRSESWSADHLITVPLMMSQALLLQYGRGWSIPIIGKECSSIRENFSECGHMRYVVIIPFRDWESNLGIRLIKFDHTLDFHYYNVSE